MAKRSFANSSYESVLLIIMEGPKEYIKSSRIYAVHQM